MLEVFWEGREKKDGWSREWVAVDDVLHVAPRLRQIDRRVLRFAWNLMSRKAVSIQFGLLPTGMYHSLGATQSEKSSKVDWISWRNKVHLMSGRYVVRYCGVNQSDHSDRTLTQRAFTCIYR